MSSFLEGGWMLKGSDQHGRELVLRLTDRDLQDAELGVTIGRHPELCDHVLDDPGVSRRHARISLRAGTLYIEDLHSLNGTLVDGTDIPVFAERPVRAGQQISLGPSKFELIRIAD